MTDDRIVWLSLEEIRYIQTLIVEPLDYYRTLFGSQKCTVLNRQHHQLLDGLSKKLIQRETAK